MNIPQIFKGALASTTLTLSTTQLNVPFTICLYSVDASRKVYYSADSGNYYFPAPTANYSDINTIVHYVTSPISNIKIVGAIGDLYQIMD